ncbi:hypothetical protein GCM10008090_33460 [Arenicella chitinivorans]|uniref:Uncharacterized protein n=1 Tax=Arenicella chitinivorans TaxID=1329800 RepID=A0A918VSJ5_9GAMM|nr:hypothetical protein [Arenicella chitinivorans]GHA20827.1 hypothetical protein GCM10008090_33460 [Arenicella chitinivorans]
MAEIQSTIYFKHPSSRKQGQLLKLFKLIDAELEDAYALANKLNPDGGRDILASFVDKLAQDHGADLCPESITKHSGYGVVYFINGGSGDYITGLTVKLVNDLCPEVHVQGWGAGDDDPWEFWFKIFDGRVVRYDDQPWEDDDEDARLLATVYRWWHEDMPTKIRVGFLNESREVEPAELSDDDYDDWVDALHDRAYDDDPVSQGVEPALGKEDVKEMVSAITELFSMFKASSKASQDPQKEAFKAESINEDDVLAAFDDISVCERNFDLDGSLKHFSKNLCGQTSVLDDDFPKPIPVKYGLYKMGLAAVLNERSKYRVNQTVDGFALLDDGRGELSYNSVTEYIEPGSKRPIKMHTRDRAIWAIENGKLQIVELHSEEYLPN